ncbi:MAG: hypothetical protein Q4B09_06670 [Lachnospiraceae bacterium]|nr:hypothetical protein [Lachnospiraceae bacterium]
MTKREFLDALSEKLYEALPTAAVLQQVQYYEGYIDGLVRNGCSEEDAVAELGDPILIARTIIESPRDEGEMLYQSQASQDELYMEGSFEAEHQAAVCKEQKESAEKEQTFFEEEQEDPLAWARSDEEEDPLAWARRNGQQASDSSYREYGAEEDFEADEERPEAAYGEVEGETRREVEKRERKASVTRAVAAAAFVVLVIAILRMVTRMVFVIGPVIVMIMLVLVIWMTFGSGKDR